MLDVDFIALKVGDVNNSANPSLGGSLDDRTFAGITQLTMPNRYLALGERIRVPIKVNSEELLGMQLSLSVDPAKATILSCQEGLVEPEQMNQSMLADGDLLISYTDPMGQTFGDQVLLTIELEARQAGWLSEFIELGKRYLPAEAYTSRLDFHDIELVFSESDSQTNSFRLYQNIPNPFFRSTIIGFELPEADEVTLRVLDVQGRVVWESQQWFAEGHQTWELEEVLESGVYYYQLQTSTDTATRKMIKQD